MFVGWGKYKNVKTRAWVIRKLLVKRKRDSRQVSLATQGGRISWCGRRENKEENPRCFCVEKAQKSRKSRLPLSVRQLKKSIIYQARTSSRFSVSCVPNRRMNSVWRDDEIRLRNNSGYPVLKFLTFEISPSTYRERRTKISNHTLSKSLEHPINFGRNHLLLSAMLWLE